MGLKSVWYTEVSSNQDREYTISRHLCLYNVLQRDLNMKTGYEDFFQSYVA